MRSEMQPTSRRQLHLFANTVRDLKTNEFMACSVLCIIESDGLLRRNPEGNAARISYFPCFLDRRRCNGFRYDISFFETARKFVYASKMQCERRDEDQSSD